MVIVIVEEVLIRVRVLIFLSIYEDVEIIFKNYGLNVRLF